jgi:LmbE family N-acetylglucosaminyl deacetylase
VVVVAAHPDDETIGAAGLLLRVRGAAVVHLTDGAPREPALRPGWPDRAVYARLRREEALDALAEAGLHASDVVCLGAVDQEAAEAIAPLARDLAGLFGALRPRLVVTHALEGGHPDHDAAAVAVRAAARLLQRRGGRAPALAEMTSYHLARGKVVVGEFLPGGAQVRERALERAHREAKARMLARYVSQRAVLERHAPSLHVERFRRASALQLVTPPHPGPLLYEALGWTTFARFRERAVDALRALGLASDDAER